jgi:hypothetical protein
VQKVLNISITTDESVTRASTFWINQVIRFENNVTILMFSKIYGGKFSLDFLAFFALGKISKNIIKKIM